MQIPGHSSQEILMAENKTKKTGEDPRAFIARIEDPKRRDDCTSLLNLFQKVTGSKPEVWGPSIIGFGDIKYKSGKNTNDWFVSGFASRKDALTIYLISSVGNYSDLLSKLGKYKTSGGCLYIKKLEDIDTSVLRELIKRSGADVKKRFPLE